MTYARHFDDRRTQSACQIAGVDKWKLLDALGTCATDFGLSHRSLSVLRALLSFHPAKHLNPTGPAIVFPANATLSDRLHGMPESTLRRHLGALVRSGLITRQDSPNRKRYARRIGGKVAVCFGFDLSPLAARAAEVFRLSRDAALTADRIAVLRAQILDLRARLIDAGQGERAALIAKTLRRKLSEDQLQALHDSLIAQPEPEEMSASPIENERHIDSEKEDIMTDDNDGLTPGCVAQHLTQYRLYFDQTPHTWAGLCAMAGKLAPMLGIPPRQVAICVDQAGRRATSVLVLGLLEQFDRIDHPVGYLQDMAKRYATGRLDLVRYLRELSADNLETGAKTRSYGV